MVGALAWSVSCLFPIDSSAVPQAPYISEDSCKDVRLAVDEQVNSGLLRKQVEGSVLGGSSYVLTSLAYMGDGLATAGQVVVIMPIACAVPIALSIVLRASVFPCSISHLLTNPGWGNEVWISTSQWRQDTTLAREYAGELAIASCYAERGRTPELKENLIRIHNLVLKYQTAWGSFPTGQILELDTLETQTRRRLSQLDPDFKDAAAAHSESKASVDDEEIPINFRHPDTGDQWIWSPLSVTTDAYEERCASIRKKSGEGQFHLASESQLERALRHQEFAVRLALIKTQPVFIVLDKKGMTKKFAWHDKQASDSKEDGLTLLCVR